MNAVKIMKRSKNETSTEVLAGQDEKTAVENTREIVRTVKGWISELQQRRRDEQLASSALKIVKQSIPATP